jgi:pimeloyl-ACP methyl ester carboxylesterase
MKKMQVATFCAVLFFLVVLAIVCLILGQSAVFTLLAVGGIASASFPLILNLERIRLSQQVRLGAPGKFVQLPEGFVHYEIGGPENAKFIVLIHGFSIPYYVWDPIFEDLKARGFRVLRYDLFGRGYSDRPKAKYERKFFVQQLDKLLKALEIMEPVNLVGLSIGAAVASGFTTVCPARVNKLVCIAPHHAAMKISLLAVPVLGEYLAAVFFAPSLQKRQKEYFYLPERFPQWPTHFGEQMRYKGLRRALLSTLRNFVNQDQLAIYKQVSKLDKPVLLIWGKEDKIVPFSGHERLLSVLEAEFLAVDKAGHLAYYDRPEVVCPRLVDFLSHDSQPGQLLNNSK